MTSRELLEWADECSDGDREAAWRSAVHCAYYSAFHAARRLLRLAGFAVPDADRAHSYFWLRLSNSGHPEVAQAGAALSALRSVRNQADYDLELIFSRRDATSQVALGEGVVDLLELVAESPETLSRIAQTMREYERDVLRGVTWRGTE